METKQITKEKARIYENDLVALENKYNDKLRELTNQRDKLSYDIKCLENDKFYERNRIIRAMLDCIADSGVEEDNNSFLDDPRMEDEKEDEE